MATDVLRSAGEFVTEILRVFGLSTAPVGSVGFGPARPPVAGEPELLAALSEEFSSGIAGVAQSVAMPDDQRSAFLDETRR